MGDVRVDDRQSSMHLLLRAREGDRSALSALFGIHVPILRRWAHGRLPRWARAFSDTADVVQDAVLNTFRRLDRLEPRGEQALQGYLRQAVQNRILDILRRAETRTREGGDSTDTYADGQPSPLALAISSQEEERYRDALIRLRDEDQAIIVARVELGYDFSQIALLTGRPTPNAARVALRRAVVRLVEEMNRV